MISLSLCMIVRDEEDVLSRCLSSVEGVFDEIIIVDTGSSDRTRGIALQFTPHIYGFQWCDDFSAARNYSFSKATMEYVMWLDADDVVSEGNRAKLVDLKKNLPPTTDVVMVKYDVAFDAYDNPTYSYYRERILKTVKQYRWVGAIHEVIQPTGNICYSDIRIQHRKTGPTDPTRNLRIYEKLLAEGKTLDPRERYYYARELMYNLQYRTAIGEYLAFLQDASGWTENKISACQDLSYCYYLVSDDEAALQSLLRSLAYDEPRAEICCDLGKHFLDRGKYIQAIFWYELAASREFDYRKGGFVFPDCYGYIPAMQLCICYDRLGQYEKAMEWNERGGALKPNDPSYLHNKRYFESRWGVR